MAEMMEQQPLQQLMVLVDILIHGIMEQIHRQLLVLQLVLMCAQLPTLMVVKR